MAKTMFIFFGIVNFSAALFVFIGKMVQCTNPDLYEGFWGSAIFFGVLGFGISWVVSAAAAVGKALASSGRGPGRKTTAGVTEWIEEWHCRP